MPRLVHHAHPAPTEHPQDRIAFDLRRARHGGGAGHERGVIGLGNGPPRRPAATRHRPSRPQAEGGGGPRRRRAVGRRSGGPPRRCRAPPAIGDAGTRSPGDLDPELLAATGTTHLVLIGNRLAGRQAPVAPAAPDVGHVLGHLRNPPRHPEYSRGKIIFTKCSIAPSTRSQIRPRRSRPGADAARGAAR